MIKILYQNIDRLIGKKINRKLIKTILTVLEIKILKENDRGMELAVPLYRVDVTREADVIEEILRLYGYNNVETDENVYSTLSYIIKPDKEKVTNIVSDYLVANGFNEIMSNSLSKEAYYANDPDSVSLNNPLSNDLNRLRTTLFYGGMEAIVHNMNRQRPNLRFFEIGKCYFYTGEKRNKYILDNYDEKEHLALFITGNRSEINWIEKDKPSSFFQMKAYIENILYKTGVYPEHLEIAESGSEFLSEGVVMKVNGNPLVDFGIVHNKWLRYFDLKSKVFYGDLNWSLLLSLMSSEPVTFMDLPRFPEVRRDLSMILEKNVKFDDISKLALKTEKNHLIKVILFDVYEGKNIEKGKKSYAISFVLQDKEKTLTDQQIDKIMGNLIRIFE